MKRQNVDILRAKEHIFSTANPHGANLLARENWAYGLAKMHYAQRQHGLEPNAIWIGGPDETITRNNNRWNQGVSYGGKAVWGGGKEKFINLDVKPNACGILVGAIDKVPSPEELLQKMNRLQGKKHFVDDVELEWDFNAGNHFIDIVEVINADGFKFPRYLVMMHGGCGELKGDNPFGMGFYWDYSKILQEKMVKEKTPWGTIRLLLDGDATEYMKTFKKGLDFSMKRREIAFKEVFGGKKVLINKAHQYMVDYNSCLLGCQQVDRKNELFPVAISADYYSYIVRGKKSFTKGQMDMLGFRERAEELGVEKYFKNANILPHGGGYTIPNIRNVKEVFTIGKERFFVVQLKHQGKLEIIRDIRSLQFGYRGGTEVIFRTTELGLGDVAAELRPIYALKI